MLFIKVICIQVHNKITETLGSDLKKSRDVVQNGVLSLGCFLPSQLSSPLLFTLMNIGQMSPLYLTQWFPNKATWGQRSVFTSYKSALELVFTYYFCGQNHSTNRHEIEASRLRKTALSQKYLSKLFSECLWIINIFLKSSLTYEQSGNQQQNKTEQTRLQFKNIWDVTLWGSGLFQSALNCYVHSFLSKIGLISDTNSCSELFELIIYQFNQ